jgi:hypothetical protein
VLFALITVALEVSGLAMLGGVCALLWVMIAYEALVYARGDNRRYLLRHGEDLEPWTDADREREEHDPQTEDRD